jgi:hypothetical protein
VGTYGVMGSVAVDMRVGIYQFYEVLFYGGAI